MASEKEAGSGIIESIHLINFMSHANLKLELGPQQNFITGPNGAGKSAILVALLTALGAKTGFTGRGARLGDMVRNSPEATSAVITVRLRNRAPEGYRPEVYGESIVVVKTISKEGPSSLKIRTAAGQDTEEMTTDKLGEILDHLNIQVDNPCAVLLQETSKNFLSQSTPKQKYSFFLQATQLAPIRNNYQAIEKNLATLEELLGRKKKQLPGLRQYVERCREAYESLNRVNQLEEQRRDLRVQAAWSAYAEKLRKLAALRDKKEKLDEGMGRKEREMEGFRASKDGAQQQLLTLEAQLA
ncbi:MAG: AAA family ATPase, partial [archaeon]|nr:AAA family ATPase [archaeon]